MRVHVQDFQSLKDVTVDVEGLTVIVGQSDIGKSALIRAISSVLFNRTGDYYVRNGAESAEVTIEDLPAIGAPLDKVSWSKGKTPGVYYVNGEKFAKVGKEAPAAVKDAGYRDVLDGLRPQLAGQFDSPFLIGPDVTDIELAAALAGASKLDIFDTAASNCATDLSAAVISMRTLSKQRDTDVAAWETVQAAIEGWTGEAVLVEVTQLQTRAARVDAAKRALARLTQARAITKPQTLPAMPTSALPAVVKALVRKRDASRVPAPMELPRIPTQPLNAVVAAVQRWVRARRVVAPLPVPTLPAGADAFPKVVAAGRRWVRARAIAEPVACPSNESVEQRVQQLDVVVGAVNRHDLHRASASSAEQSWTQSKQQVEDSENGLAAFRQEQPTCPTCDQPWSATNG